jgi:hypothetical protein
MHRYIRSVVAATLLPAVFLAPARSNADAVPGPAIKGCYSKHDGRLRILPPGVKQGCHRWERPIAWNQQGVPGPPGPATTGTVLASQDVAGPILTPTTSQFSQTAEVTVLSTKFTVVKAGFVHVVAHGEFNYDNSSQCSADDYTKTSLYLYSPAPTPPLGIAEFSPGRSGGIFGDISGDAWLEPRTYDIAIFYYPAPCHDIVSPGETRITNLHVRVISY